jgi:YbgC/YbaW family acyl-CoA thioester hydrolase
VSASFRYRRQVQFAETDMAGIVHFSRYFRFMEEAEHALWRAAGRSIAPADPVHGWPRVAAAFDYKRPLRFEDQFTVSVRISAVSRRTIQYGFELRRDLTFIGHGTITVACVTVDANGVMASVDLPEGLVDQLRAVMTEVAPGDATTGP